MHDNGQLFGAAIIELPCGEPVELERIAARSRRPKADVEEFLRCSPAEWDEGGASWASRFFASSEATESWRRGREDVIVVPVAEAFEPLRRLMQRWDPEANEAA